MPIVGSKPMVAVATDETVPAWFRTRAETVRLPPVAPSPPARAQVASVLYVRHELQFVPSLEKLISASPELESVADSDRATLSDVVDNAPH